MNTSVYQVQGQRSGSVRRQEAAPIRPVHRVEQARTPTINAGTPCAFHYPTALVWLNRLGALKGCVSLSVLPLPPPTGTGSGRVCSSSEADMDTMSGGLSDKCAECVALLVESREGERAAAVTR